MGTFARDVIQEPSFIIGSAYGLAPLHEGTTEWSMTPLYFISIRIQDRHTNRAEFFLSVEDIYTCQLLYRYFLRME